MSESDKYESLEGIAIIGMSGRFPGAKNIEEFWQNLRNGVESVSFFTDQELEQAGVAPAVVSDPNYVKARAVLEDVELFDASFFGFNAREAQITDPQHRLFLECAWSALENAGYNSETFDGSISVYGGTGGGTKTYLLNNIYANRELRESVGDYQIFIGNDKDFLTTRISYKLNLKGPSFTVQTACSTSLVAIVLACQSLLNYQSDMALAGGISIMLPQKEGYLYHEGMILSPDGHCRAFDAKAKGTVGGSGVGMVVLKRLESALADGDYIHAVIKGSAINNDGSFKVGYTAPSVDGQAEVIAEALATAEVEPETITYVEAHGTGTPLGDPIEIAALTQAYSLQTQKKGFCAIGSVKTNVGHLDTAAGVTGLIKTVLALKHKLLPPSLHFETPNPKIDFANSPFYVNTKLCEWKGGSTPRRAGVSSFGIGGTNAHVILEEAPTVEPAGESRPSQLLVLSAKTSSALDTATTNLVAHLKQHPELNLADVAYTYQVGRRALGHRRILMCHDVDDAAIALETLDAKRVLTSSQEPRERPVVFMFPGQGAQYVNMAKELYQVEPVFREQVDLCLELLLPHLGLDLRQVFYPNEDQIEAATQQLKQTAITQPALFVIEYALAKLWMHWGVRPFAMIGHSIGEYVAAILAGVFSLSDALALVATRGRLIQLLPTGSMLAVPLPELEVQPLLGEQLSLAAINGSSLCVVSGSTDAVAQLEGKLSQQGVECSRLHTSHAFHSQMMQPILEEFTEQVKKVNLQPPKIPYVSNVTGTWITAKEATDPSYWTKHLRSSVLFNAGLQELLKEPERVLLEVGPGRTLSTLAKRHPDKGSEQVVLSSLRHPHDQQSDVAFLLNTLAQLWLTGIQVDWSGFYAHEQRHRIPLPTYPFERQRYWIEPQKQPSAVLTPQKSLGKKPDVADWFYIPAWKQSPLPLKAKLQEQKFCWLVFIDACGLGDQIVKRLEQEGQDVITVMVSEQFSKLSDHGYTINPRQRDDYDALLEELCALDKNPKTIAHFWNVTPNEKTQSRIDFFEKSQEFGFYSLLFLAQALGSQNTTDSLQIVVVSNNIQQVTGVEVLCPEKATVLGPCKVIPQEYPHITCRSIDVVLPDSGTEEQQKLIDQLIAELSAKTSDNIVALRDEHRQVQTFESVRLDRAVEGTTRLREGGVYLITGGLGGIGLVLAEYLAQTVQAKLILVGRKALPNRNEWLQWLATHDQQDGVSRKIRKVQALEKLGASVLFASADVANLEQMLSVKTQAEQKFGVIHGVIHAAGIAGGGVIQLKTPEIAASVLEPKVKGTLVLDLLFKDVQLDFLALTSSINSILGEFGQVDYCAANIFLDAEAHYNQKRRGRFTFSINWDAWREVGMAVNTAVPTELIQRRQESLEKGISSKEGVDAFSRILGNSLPQVVVSTQDIPTRIEHAFTASSAIEELEKSLLPKPTYSRPELKNAYIVPKNDIEQKIANIWQESLGIAQVGIHDNFFELGGDSLVAVSLFAQVKKIFTKNLPLVTIFQAPTVEQLASIICQEESSKPWSSLVAIQTGGDKPPLFGIHCGHGEVAAYYSLAAHLGSQYPVYALQPKGLDEKQLPHSRIEDMAADYIREIRTVQPEGPYFLGGFSMGGKVAFEMAQQLHTQGQKVAILALFDTQGPDWLKPLPVHTRVLRHLSNLLRLKPKDKLTYLKNNLGRRFYSGHSQPLPQAYQLSPLRQALEQADSYYVPQVYPGRAIIFRAGEPLEGWLDWCSVDPQLGWGGLVAEGLEIHEFSGNHVNMFREPNVRYLAEKLKACLDAVQVDQDQEEAEALS